MIIENGDSKFTEEEKRNLVVREYTSEEIEKNKKAYVNKSTKKCFPLIVLIVLCSICSYILPAMSYAVDIVMVIIIFLFILTIIINILNYRIVKRRHYMVALIAENARVGSYTDEFDERYRRIAEEITTLKEEQIEARRKKKLADSYEQRLKDMDSFLEKQTCQIPEFDNDLVRRLIASIKVVSVEKLIIRFQSGIVMEQEIRYE